MPIIGWIRDLFGIQKDMYETKKTRLEIEKIEDEKREKLITPATLDDVKKYDPKIRQIESKIPLPPPPPPPPPPLSGIFGREVLQLMSCVAVLLLLLVILSLWFFGRG